MGLLRSVVPTIAGSHGMFSRLQHALQVAMGRQVSIIAAVHNEINLWRNLISSLAEHPTHLRDICPNEPT